MVGLSNPRSLIDAPCGELVLQIRGTARDGQVVRLHAAKCTIGSAPNCTLRLRSRAVGPLHCLILRGRSQTIIRRWNADTRLNGRTFTDAPLQSGDRISIAGIDLEVVETGAGGDPTEATPWEVDRQSARLDAVRVELEVQRTLLDRQTSDLETDRRLLDDQWVKLVAEEQRLADEQDRCQTERRLLDQQRAELAIERAEAQRQSADQAAEFESRQAELEAAAREIESRRLEIEAAEHKFESQRQEWESHHNEAAELLAASSNRLTVRLSELEQARYPTDEQQAAWEAQQAEAQQRLDARAEEIRVCTESLDAREKALGERSEAIDAQEKDLAERSETLSAQEENLAQGAEALAAGREELRRRTEDSDRRGEQVEALCTELKSLRAELESARSSLESERAEWERQQADWQRQRDEMQRDLDERAARMTAEAVLLAERRRQSEADGQSASPAPDVEQSQQEAAEIEVGPVQNTAPESLSDVLRRLGAKVDFDEDETPSTEASEPAPAPPVTIHQAPSSQASHPSGHEDEESIDDYMARLLERVRSGPASSAAPQPQSRLSQPSAVVSPETVAESPNSEAAPAISQAEPVERTPRAPAVKPPIDLSAMRELANLSAKSAINRHDRSRMSQTSRGALLLTVTGIVSGGWLLWAWSYVAVDQNILYAAIAAFLVAVLWGTRYAALTGRLMVNRRGHFESMQPESKPVEATADESSTEEPADGEPVGQAPRA